MNETTIPGEGPFRVGDRVQLKSPDEHSANAYLGRHADTLRGILTVALVRDDVLGLRSHLGQPVGAWLAKRFEVVSRPGTTPEPTPEHRADIERIGKALAVETFATGLCGKYRDFVNRVNPELTVPLPVPEPEHELSIPGGWATVTAATRDDAIRKLRSALAGVPDIQLSTLRR